MSRWPVLRALLITAHLVAVVLCALPAPVGAMHRSSWKDPTVQAELGAWRGRLDAVGVHLTKAEFEAHLWDAMVQVMAVRDVVMTPIEPYLDLCGTWQSWRMFVAPQRYPARLEVSVREHGVWRVVLRERDAELDWMADVLHDDRMRSAVFRYAWPKYKGSWRSFVLWLARRADQDFPEADALRARFLRFRTLSPDERARGVVPAEKPESEVVLELAELPPLGSAP